MSQYKLTYFNVMGLGEPIRFLLHFGGDGNFEDYRFEREDWPKLKPTMPYGQVPVLEIDGKKYAQTLPICRYLAKKYNLLGKTALDNLQIDSIAAAIHDFRKRLSEFFMESDPIIKAKKKETAVKEVLPFYLNKFEDLVKNNQGYFHNGDMSYADIFFVSLIDHMSFIAGDDITKNYPNLKSLQEKVLAFPQIQAYLKKRPKTDI